MKAWPLYIVTNVLAIGCALSKNTLLSFLVGLICGALWVYNGLVFSRRDRPVQDV